MGEKIKFKSKNKVTHMKCHFEVCSLDPVWKACRCIGLIFTTESSGSERYPLSFVAEDVEWDLLVEEGDFFEVEKRLAGTMPAELFAVSPVLAKIDFKTVSRVLSLCGKSVPLGMLCRLELWRFTSPSLYLNFLRSRPLLNSMLAKVTPMLGQLEFEAFVDPRLNESRFL